MTKRHSNSKNSRPRVLEQLSDVLEPSEVRKVIQQAKSSDILLEFFKSLLEKKLRTKGLIKVTEFDNINFIAKRVYLDGVIQGYKEFTELLENLTNTDLEEIDTNG